MRMEFGLIDSPPNMTKTHGCLMVSVVRYVSSFGNILKNLVN